jgi:CTP:phosphocholine cytidylyltransferase-like protein
MNFIILADKYQKGMKSRGCVGLIKVNTRLNAFDHQYRLIKNNFKRSKIIYIYGFDHKKMTSYIYEKNYKDVVTIYNDMYEEYNYTYSLSLAQEYMAKDFFIIFGDTIFKKEVFKNQRNANSQIFINKKQKNTLGCILDENQVIHNISFDLDNYLMDMYYINKKDSAAMKNIVMNPKYKNCFVFEIINKMIDSGINFSANIKNKKDLSSKINKIKVKI